jgi:hypothetical protein
LWQYITQQKEFVEFCVTIGGGGRRSKYQFSRYVIKEHSQTFSKFQGGQDTHQNSCNFKYFPVVMVPFLDQSIFFILLRHVICMKKSICFCINIYIYHLSILRVSLSVAFSIDINFLWSRIENSRWTLSRISLSYIQYSKVFFVKICF